MRNDSACGSTIGPILSAKLGMRTVGKLKHSFTLNFAWEQGGAKRERLRGF